MIKPVHVIGGGLAGCEAAHFLALRGIPVVLHEMRPIKSTPAHKTSGLAELVCSNSLKSKEPESAPGMLKAEMNHIGSLVLTSAMEAEVPSGQSLGVDRDRFSEFITRFLESQPNVQIVREELKKPLTGEINLIATGPLTSENLANWIYEESSSEDLYFYDAIAPILDASTIDMNSAFLANRYDKGEEVAYLNCPLTESEYMEFYNTLMTAEKVSPKSFEKEKFFQGCQPIETIASTGIKSLLFGPMKPVGLKDPKTGREPFAVLQLRPENNSKTAYNMVGFQTKLKYGEQKRVFSIIPALKNVEFHRLGSIHRNTYICGPKVLNNDLSLKKYPLIYFGGQITGVEGYLESAASGMLAGIFIAQRILGKPVSPPPLNTALGALLGHVVGGSQKNFQPSNIHFGLFDPAFFEDLGGAGGKDVARSRMATQAITNFKNWWSANLVKTIA